MVIEQVNAKRNLSLKVNVAIARNKDTNLQTAKPSNGTQQNKLWKQYLDGITILGVDVTTMMNLGTLEKTMWNITWGKETPLEDVLFVYNLDTLPSIVWTLEGLKMKRKPKMTILESKWGSNGFQNILRMQVQEIKHMSLKNWVPQVSQLDIS